MAKSVRTPMETVTVTHNRYSFTPNIVVDVKLEEIAPGKSWINYYLNGLKYDNKTHPIPDYTRYPRAADLASAMEGWAAGVHANPTGETQP